MSPYEVIADWSTLGWPLLANHLWQATLFSLLALAAAMSLRRAPARARYFVWLLALIKFALPSVFLFYLTAQVGVDLSSLPLGNVNFNSGSTAVSPLLSPVTSPAVVQSAAEPHAREAHTSGAASLETTPARGGSLSSVITCLWLAGCAVLALVWLRKSYGLSVALNKGREVNSGREAEALQRVRSLFKMSREVRLMVTPAVSEPGVWGVWRPVIMLPDGVTDRLNDAELETIFMHELSHIERWDNLAGNFQRALCCLFWFHPLIWVIDRRLLAEREQACDDTVVRRGGASAVYANGIAKVCRYCLGWEVAGLSKVTGSDLKKRVERIISNHAGKKMSASQAAILTVLSVSALTLSLAAGDGKGGAPSLKVMREAALDPRFEFITPRSRRVSEGAGAQDSMQAYGRPREEDVLGHPPLKELMSRNSEFGKVTGSPIEVAATDGPTRDQAAVAANVVVPPGLQIPTPEDISAPDAGNIQAAVVRASGVSYGDLKGFIGRYEVDPKRAENFVLDITFESGELWLKPSHSARRRLIRQSEVDFVDSNSDYDLTFILDGRDRAIGLRLNSWGINVIARKLLLPRPSLKGNIVFRLRGFPDAKVVAVAGSFNNWNQSQFLFSKEGGEWVCRVNLPAGAYQYKFIVDGNWLTDPTNPKIVYDERGNENSLLKTE
jgi:beta-lactamase regulating signal transducer with metallopeptidase domain